MDFLLNEEQRAVQKVAFDFAQNEIAPYAREYDEQGKINWDALKKMGPLGLLGGPIPEEYGRYLDGVAAVPSKAAHPDLGQQFITYATQPGTFAIWYSRGIDPRKGAQ